MTRTRRVGLLRWVGLLLAVAACPCVFASEKPTVSTVRESHGGSSTWHLDLPVLDALGVHVAQVSGAQPLPASAKKSSYRALKFPALDLGRLRFRESDGLPRAFAGGRLQHGGGFVLRFPGGEADLRHFALQPAARAPFALDVIGGDGQIWFTLDRGHYQLEDGNRTFALRYMNLHLSRYFAQRLQRREFAGLAVGGMETLSPVSDPAAISGPVCSADFPGVNGAVADIQMVYQSVDAESGGPDSIHFRRCGLPDASGNYQDASCTASSSDRGVVFAPDTSLYNAGSAAVAWHQMFTHPAGLAGYPPYGNDQHPFLVWNLYRIDADGALHQIAASGVKHAFNTINKNCGCPDHANNYPTCEDSYSEYSNDIDATTTPNYLGPRSELIPARGVWGRCLSVFDKNCDSAMDADAGAQNDFQYRTVARESDIAPDANARWLFEYWYVVRDQSNIYDAMGYRPLTFAKIAGSGSAYLWQANLGTFSDGSLFRNGAAIDAWIDPSASPAGAMNQELVTAEGRARVAVRTTALGGGIFRYDYAVMNFDFARAVIDAAHPNEPDLHLQSNDGFGAFSLPLDTTAQITDVVFSDTDHDATNDWTLTRDADGLHWQAPAGHALNWGTLYRFSFTADRMPAAATATLGVATAGAPASYSTATLAPQIDRIFADRFGD